jgi:hypothetical protein
MHFINLVHFVSWKLLDELKSYDNRDTANPIDLSAMEWTEHLTNVSTT